jgi:hypothetical protein
MRNNLALATDDECVTTLPVGFAGSSGGLVEADALSKSTRFTSSRCESTQFTVL